ncbi:MULTISPECIES: hypothetical protein [Rhizobium]|jgi:hypothetical protein|uniref:hypothetical protein n=1 Tax=Rhizobium TaxID=379 RepID=UPI001FD28777|nr:hypothetical protein [Rhizobium lusitanum]
MVASLPREDRLCLLIVSTETLCSRTPLCAPKRLHSADFYDQAVQRRLWTVSEELTGVTFPVR